MLLTVYLDFLINCYKVSLIPFDSGLKYFYMWHVRKYPLHEVWFTLLIHHRMHNGCFDVCIQVCVSVKCKCVCKINSQHGSK